MADSKSKIGKAYVEKLDGRMELLKFREPTDEEMVTLLPIGFTEIFLGQKCQECPTPHGCDAVCLRFSPRTFLCKGCKQYHRHRKIDELLRTYHMNKLLDQGA